MTDAQKDAIVRAARDTVKLWDQTLVTEAGFEEYVNLIAAVRAAEQRYDVESFDSWLRVNDCKSGRFLSKDDLSKLLNAEDAKK